MGVTQFVCSFRSSSTSGCGLIDYKKTWPEKILPLTCCQNSVDSHLQKHSINRRSIQNECDFIKTRAGLFNEDDETLTICPKHRYILGVGWRSSKMCSLGWKCAKKSRSNSKGTITKEQSFFLKKHHDVLIQIGSGVCTNCRKELVQKMVTASAEMEQEESTKCNVSSDNKEYNIDHNFYMGSDTGS
ncbi:uncharacterized protein LOC133188021 [Saccostrea echinata]|uniref:uncharacterized protein LOC133188021 n=1 Tax=Saccostrea echinata TaxID=191078 RepID=UPI002A822EBA|nr:uncharacterized protein LOC133188021 [Saccostrea echinata]